MECAAHTSRAVDPDSSIVLLDDTARDVQAQAHAGEPPIVDVARTMKAFENHRLILGGNADALVAHAEACLPVLPPEIDNHRRLLRAVL